MIELASISLHSTVKARLQREIAGRRRANTQHVVAYRSGGGIRSRSTCSQAASQTEAVRQSAFVGRTGSRQSNSTELTRRSLPCFLLKHKSQVL
jgi:hypothetical protein